MISSLPVSETQLLKLWSLMISIPYKLWSPRTSHGTGAILSAEPVLKHYNPKVPLIVQADASKNAWGGAALLQERHPLAYAWRSLTMSEQDYCQMEKELLSVQFTLEKFHQYTYVAKSVFKMTTNPWFATHRKTIQSHHCESERCCSDCRTIHLHLCPCPGQRSSRG